MKNVRQAPLPWQECEFVSATNAGRILSVGIEGVRDHLGSGELEAFKLPNGNKFVISVSSILSLLERVERVHLENGKAKKSQMNGRPLRLVVNNPN
jgi:hypothetical protein